MPSAPLHFGPSFVVHPEVASALADHRPVVALESTLITHGLPSPTNVQTARAAEEAVREANAIPATIAILEGVIRVGLLVEELERLADARDVVKASRRDLGPATALGKTAGTTVSATMAIAHTAGIHVFATGGIGGAHRPPAHPWDISADLYELGRTPVLVVCAGAKSILDLPRTLEILETSNVPVLGYRTDKFPAFLVSSSTLPVSARVNTPHEAAAIVLAHWHLDGAGVLLAQSVAEEQAFDADDFAACLEQAESAAARAQIQGKDLTPYLLARIAEASGGRSLEANRTLIVANARLAGHVAHALAGDRGR